jgi:hypothetical protein
MCDFGIDASDLALTTEPRVAVIGRHQYSVVNTTRIWFKCEASNLYLEERFRP